jgi:ACR3 family arsenite transporter
MQFLGVTVVAAIKLFGFESGATRATVICALIEVPVMLSVVLIVKRGKF